VIALREPGGPRRNPALTKKASPPPTDSRRHAGRVLLVLGLLAVITGGFALAGVNAWAWYHYRAAEADLAHRRFVQARQHLDHCLWAWPRSAET
jgi:hypothetical protein